MQEEEATVIDGNNLVIEDQYYTGHLSAYEIHADGRQYHTFRTATVLVNGSGIRFRNCVFENTAGPGGKSGQAIALYLDGDDISLENCIIRGYQDTLFLAPLPVKEREKDGFIGPGEFLQRTPRTFRFEHCLIEGSVDFVFGGATAYFHRCEFRSLEEGYVFAPSTPEDIATGFEAEDCIFTAAAGVPDGSCYLARPWREYGAVLLKHCYYGSHISQEKWKDWSGALAAGTARFQEEG